MILLNHPSLTLPLLPVVAPLLQDEGLLAAARARPLPLLALEAAHRPVRKVLQRGAPGRHLERETGLLLRGYCFFDFAACDGPLILFERFSLSQIFPQRIS